MNLTKLEKARKLPNVVSEELSKKYGGEVLDFSDKNYILYAHVLSNKEKLEDVINGRSNGKSNFISVSPISYAGQKYYYDYSNMILLYDEIRTGSFICSSRENIGSNRLIKNNSSEVSVQNVRQKGILETSSATKQNAEALLYREGLIPKGIALPGGREPNTEEMECHKKYNLPFVITQEPRGVIENVKEVFKPNTEYEEQLESNKTLEKVLQILSPKINIKKENDIYTGREIGLFTDSHALYEPTLAVLEDMRKNGITEIYSLGDNIGLGPNPTEVLDMLSYYKVTSIMGNSEYYNTLGIEPFTYFNPIKEENQEWTRNRLGTDKIERMKLWTPSIDITVGDKKIALCHFANDIRWDYRDHSTWTYQDNFKEGVSSKQFLYTNSPESRKKIQDIITSNRRNLEYIRGLLDAQNSPLFNGKKVTDYDSIIQGHVHFQMEDKLDDIKVHTLRAAGIGYKDDPKDMACYYVLKEKKDGTYDIEKKLVSFNRNLLLSNIKSSSIPHKEPILRMTN
jgi:predicted phosphodiesterase